MTSPNREPDGVEPFAEEGPIEKNPMEKVTKLLRERVASAAEKLESSGEEVYSPLRKGEVSGDVRKIKLDEVQNDSLAPESSAKKHQKHSTPPPQNLRSKL
jgi:hypothetical protein